ncbi:unnamed protein product, partial [Rotaria magnacalcarata]
AKEFSGFHKIYEINRQLFNHA